MTYPFDPSVRRHVTDLLYALLPALYRVRDLPEGATEPLKTAAPPGTEELYKFLNVLAAPLAEVRENIEELHADLFIDKCADWVLPYLAEMVGMKLVFPDAGANRRDVRGTVAWRRRKGTPAMLQEMGSDLSGQMVVTQEGFQRILLSQDLNLLRPTRTVPRIGPALLAEQASGPLDAAFHAVDPRRIGRSTGRYHPRHVTHWTHPTQLFPLREGTACAYKKPGAADLRYVFHPLGAEGQLRIRRASPADRVPTDRVPVMHFAARPGDYFDQEGTSNARFTVRIAGLPGGVAAPSAELRAASAIPAGGALVRDAVTVTVLERTSERLTSSVEVAVLAVELGGAQHDTPQEATAKVRGGVRIHTAEATPLPADPAPVSSPFIAMLRLRPAGSATAAYFPGATLEIAGTAIDARLAAADAGLAALGFLEGALIVDVPATWVWGERWFFLAADGSVYDAQSPGAAEAGAFADLALAAAGGDQLALPGDVLTVGPGPAWPPLPRTAAPERCRSIPSAPSRGPVVLHGAPALRRTGSGFVDVAQDVAMGIVFAARTEDRYEPFLRLDWTGGDPTAATGFSVLTSAGAAINTADALRARLASIAELADLSGDALELHVRLEAELSSIVLPPCEVVYTSATGEALLIHLPQLETGETGAPGLAMWSPSLAKVSPSVSVSADGSTYVPFTTEVARYAYGSVAPLRGATSLRRRRVRQRNLCPWRNETPGHEHAPTPPDYLDIDPLHGLFAFAEAAPAYTTSIEGLAAPAAVTVDYQDCYSDHIGARPDAREPILDAEQPTPTRLVVGGGRFHRGAPASWHNLPRYATLSDALAAIAADPAAANADEVIQIEDSATYTEGALTWPGNVRSLVIQAAEFERPVLVFGADWATNPSPTYAELTLRGLVLATHGHAVVFPEAGTINVQFCTVAEASGLLRFAGPPDGRATIHILRSITGRIQLDGEQRLSLTDSVVDAAGGKAIEAPDGTVELARVTVVARPGDLAAGEPATLVRVLEATEALFTERVVALDRFHGCIRYSRIAPGSQLPRRHRVVEDEPSFVTRDRDDPAHLRLAETCPRAVLRGAEDGSEMGAFHDVRLAQRGEALLRRLIEYTPAGLSTGILRLD